jgi:hypothetical protein
MIVRTIRREKSETGDAEWLKTLPGPILDAFPSRGSYSLQYIQLFSTLFLTSDSHEATTLV